MLLSKYKVLEYSTYVAAPSAAGMMADWGAQVIKVEPVGGDPSRGYFSTVGRDFVDNPIFDVDNRGKQSIGIDTSKPEGLDIMRKLIAETDVFLTNLRPGSLERGRLDWESVRAINPRLIFASVTGYGLQGEDRDRPGFDTAAFWSRAGVGHMTAPKGTDPFLMRIGFGDHITGIAMLSGILAALLHREETGEGGLVETSLMRTGIYTVSSELAIQQRFGKLASNRDRHHGINPLNNYFRSSDGNWVCVLTRHGYNVDWPRVLKAAGCPELENDERFATPKARRENAATLVDLLDAGFVRYSLEEISRRLDEVDVAWAPLQTPTQVLEDSQALATGAFVDLPQHDGGSVKSIAGPVRFYDRNHGPQGPTPKAGEHTRSILHSIGMSEDDLSSLSERGIIKLADG
jgi:crotonobetainyl-CoA:carnitine CoA-transferase CaiB-like acyl-CoA transferase